MPELESADPPRMMSAEELIGELELHDLSASVIALDADGTLWSGDVGEEVFEHFSSRGVLRETGYTALAELAERFDVPREGDANALALRMFRAYQAGSFPEREICEMMTWCYAGFGEREFREEVRTLLAGTNFASRLQRELEPILDWARRRSVRAVVISASPQIAVEEAARYWGIAGTDIAASQAACSQGELLAYLARPVPYADTKPSAGRELFGQAPWLASFGDNVFDLDMLAAAEAAVLVRPKPALLARVPTLPNAVFLAPRV